VKSFILGHLGGKQSLRRRTIFGGGWMAVRHFSLAAVEIVKTVVFARILDAYAYGVMALVTMAVSFLDSFTTLGIEMVVIRDNDDYRKKLDYYWTIKAIRGVSLFLAAWVFAPLFASLYDKQELITLIRFMSVTFLFDGFSGFGREVYQRTMAFARGAGYEIAASTAAICAGIIVLFQTHSVWALAATSVFLSMGRFAASYALFPWVPRFRFNRDALKIVFTFGVSIIGMNALHYLFNNFDKAIIAKMYDLEQLGFYARANFLALLPATYLANAIAPVFLPSMRTIAGDPVRLKSAFYKATAAYSVMFGVIGLCLFVFARPFVLFLYGDQWLAVVPLFQIMIVFGTVKSMTGVCPTILILKGKPWVMTITAAVMVGVFCGLCIPMMNFIGLYGIAWSLVIAGVLSNGLAMVFSIRSLRSQRPESGAQRPVIDRLENEVARERE